MEENGKIPLFKAALTYGAIVGLASGVFGLILYFIDQSFAKWAMIASPVVMFGLLIVALVLFKKEYGNGYAKYGQLVLMSFLVGIVTAIITATFTFAIYQMDESYLQDTKYFAIEKMDEQLDKADAKYQEKLPADQYDKVEQRMKEQRKKQVNKIENRSAFSLAFSSIIGVIFMSVIIGLIASIFIKKDPPEPTVN